MRLDGVSRRQILLYSSIASTHLWGGAEHQHQGSAVSSPRELKFFSKEESIEIELIASLIIPTDETGGAQEAGVIYFIDTALVTFDREKQAIYRDGLERIHQEVARMASHQTRLVDLNPDQQLQLIKRIADSEFFKVIRTHTVMGFLGTPARGGNREEVGWKLIGFEDKFTFQPPFGHYDADSAA